MTERGGGCSCRAVRYRLVGDPLHVGVCHCTLCRKESGSVFVAYALWPIDAFSMRGEIRSFDGRSFCPACGSRLFNLTDTTAEIRLGSLDEAPSTLTPTREGWIERREPWLACIAGASQARHDPPS